MSLAFSRILFDMPTCANGPHHLWQGGSRWGEHEIVALLLRISETAADEQKVASIILPLMQHGNDGPVEEPGPFGSLTHREALPILFAQLCWLLGTSVQKIGLLYTMEQAFLPKHVR
jgi:hypothetical protein